MRIRLADADGLPPRGAVLTAPLLERGAMPLADFGNAMRELLRSGPGLGGVTLMILLFVVALYVLLAFPLDFGESQWSNPVVWVDNPKAVPAGVEQRAAPGDPASPPCLRGHRAGHSADGPQRPGPHLALSPDLCLFPPADVPGRHPGGCELCRAVASGADLAQTTGRQADTHLPPRRARPARRGKRDRSNVTPRPRCGCS